METTEAKPKKQSVSDIWQSLKDQFSSMRKNVPKSQTNWNAFSKKTESSSDAILTSPDALCVGGLAECDTQPFILGITRHRGNSTELDDIHSGLRTTAKAVLRSLEEEKQARAVLLNLEEEKKPPPAVQLDAGAAAAASAKLIDTQAFGTSCNDVLEKPSITAAVENNSDGAKLSSKGEQGYSVTTRVDCVQETWNLHEQDKEEIVGSTVSKQSQSVHLVKVNSTLSDLKSKLSESSDGEEQRDLEKDAEDLQVERFASQQKSTSFSDSDHPISGNPGLGSSNRLEERQNNEAMEDIKIILDDSNRNCKLEMETTTVSLNDKTSSGHPACTGKNFPSAFSDLMVYSSDMHDEPPTSATDEELIKLINKDVNCLHDPAIDVRYEALHSLHRALLGDFVGEIQYLHKRTSCKGEDEADSEVVDTGLFESAEKFSWCVEEVAVKPLLKVFSDGSERCRYLSVTILIALLHTTPRSVITLLPYIIPVISSRFPIKSLPSEDPSTKVEVRIVEKSEDIRLLLINFLHGLLKASKSMIHPFASDTATILTAAACDSSPEVLMETFSAMTLFGEICGTKLKPVAKLLISVVVRSLAHNRHRVRVAAVRAIHRLVLCGAHESIYDLTAFRDPNTVPIRAFYHPDPKTQYLALLAGDRSIQVREQLLRTVASWLRELNERKEHECRLVPYLLSGFTDESPIIQDLAFQLMQEVGHQYEEENENEVKDTQIYLPQDIDDLPTVAGKPLPPAFKSRPCLGARILARSCCSVMLHALSGDLDAWTTGTKSLAADFLHTMLLFVEEHITMHLQQVIVMLMKALKDPVIEMKVSTCANVLGHFVDPTAYLLIILPRITGELYTDASVPQLGQAVKLLAKVMEGSSASRLTRHIPEICSVLSESDLMKSIQTDVNQSIIAVAREMVRAWTEQVKEEIISILWILLNAAAAADFTGRPSLEAESTIHNLATACGNSSGDALVGKYAEMILDLLPHPQFWAMRSLDVLVFCRVAQVAPFAPPSSIERIFLKIAWFGWGTWDPDTKLWLLRAIQKMVQMTVAAAASSPSERGETISHIEEGMVTLLENFLVPCLGQVRDGVPALRTPTLETITEIICKSSSNILPPALARALSDLERFDNKRDPRTDDEEKSTFSAPSRGSSLFLCLNTLYDWLQKEKFRQASSTCSLLTILI